MNLASRNTVSGQATVSYTPNAFHQNVEKGPRDATPESLKVFIKNISEELPDSLLEALLGELGPLQSFKRTRNEKNQPVSFAFAEFREVNGLVNCWRILNKFRLAGKIVEVIINQQAKGLVANHVESVRTRIHAQRPELTAEQLDAELTVYLAANDPVIVNKVTSLVEGFERNKDKIVKEEKKTGHKLYTEEKLNTHKQKYGLRNARELEELFIKELKAWIEEDTQFRAKLDRELEEEKQTYQLKKQLLSKALYSKAELPRDSRRAAEQKKLLAADFSFFRMENEAEFFDLELQRLTEPSPSVPHSLEMVLFSEKRAKEGSASKLDEEPVPKGGALFRKVEISQGNRLSSAPIPLVTQEGKPGQKTIEAPESFATLPFAESIMRTPGAIKLLQERLETQRIKHELLKDNSKLKVLLDLRKSIPSRTAELFAARIKWKDLEKVF